MVVSVHLSRSVGSLAEPLADRHLLSANRIVHAAIDADSLRIAYLPGSSSADIRFRNLEAVWRNFAAAGVDRLLLAQAIEHRGEIERIRAALPGVDVVVCRLTADIETMRQRVRLREPGSLQDQFVARVAELNAILDEAHVEEFSLDNDAGSVTAVAGELLARAGW